MSDLCARGFIYDTRNPTLGFNEDLMEVFGINAVGICRLGAGSHMHSEVASRPLPTNHQHQLRDQRLCVHHKLTIAEEILRTTLGIRTPKLFTQSALGQVSYVSRKTGSRGFRPILTLDANKIYK